MFLTMRTSLFNLKQHLVISGSEGTRSRAGQGMPLDEGARPGQGRAKKTGAQGRPASSPGE